MFPSFPADHPILHTPAVWHGDETVPREDFAVVLFRRAFTAAKAIARASLWISASQRFELWCDGRRVARGPARSDRHRWGVVKVALGKLSAGPHILAVRVVHFGTHGGCGQMGGPGFLLVRGDGALAGVVDTTEGWRSHRDRSITPIDRHAWGGRGRYYPVGCGEELRCADALWDWQGASFADGSWVAAGTVATEADDRWGNLQLKHRLRPDPLPPMEEWDDRFTRLADVPDDLRAAGEAWLRGDGALTIPAGRTVRLALDRGEPVNAWPEITVSGGAGARIDVVAAESPYAPDRSKGDRGDIAGKELYGHRSAIIPDGGTGRACGTLWLRSFRYLELTVVTGDRPLTLEGIRLTATSFPLRRRGRFVVDAAHRPAWDAIDAVSWRTIRLCAHETFFDCPHFEQCQFPGDSRIQALYHYAVCDDDRLARKAIDDFQASRLSDGMLQCRWPSNLDQILPTYALQWVGMLDDFRRWRGDPAFVAPYLPAAREAVEWFLRQRRADGMLGRIGHAPFVDWADVFPIDGNPPQDRDGGSAILSMMAAQGCAQLAALEPACGWSELAPRWRREAAALIRATLRACWSPARGLLADTAAQRTFTVHAQVEAALAGAWAAPRTAAILRRSLTATGVGQPGSHYYRAHLIRAARLAGMPGLLHEQLPRWTSCLTAGLMTWPESEHNPPRSDCHAWSVAPGYESYTGVLGIEPTADAVGCDRLRLAPCLGPLMTASGTLPTPHGPVRVALERGKVGTRVEVESPVPLLVSGRQRPLAAGRHRLLIDAGVVDPVP